MSGTIPLNGELHRSKWNPKELHLGPADNCYTCETWKDPRKRTDDEAAVIFSALSVGLLTLVLVAYGVSRWWWS